MRILKLILLFSIATMLAPLSAHAQPEGSIELESIEERIKSSAEEEKRLREEAKAYEREVEALRFRLVETANTIQTAEREITDIDDTIAELQEEQSQSEAALRTESANLSEILAALQSLELSRPPALIVSPDDANTAARAAMLLSGAAPQVEARAARLRGVLEDLTRLSDQLTEERSARTKASQDLQSRRSVLAELMAQKEKERDVATSLAAAAQKETANLAGRATTLREVINRLERLAHLVIPRLKPPAPKPVLANPVLPNNDAPDDGGPIAPSIKTIAPKPYIAAKRFSEARGALRAPVSGKLINEFGEKRPDGGEFQGLRFSTGDRAIVIAPFEGRVVFARSWDPIGNLIVMDVGESYHILFMGVGAILTQEGGQVSAGEPIARMLSGGSDLDLEIRRNGEPVNPASWLKR